MDARGGAAAAPSAAGAGPPGTAVGRIEISHVSKVFGSRPGEALAQVKAGLNKERLLAQTGHNLALYDVTLSIAPGEVFVVMGLSGSGKSTLIRHLNRLIDPTEGRIEVDGTDILALSIPDLVRFRRGRLGMVFQHFALLPHRTVLDNAAYGLELQGVGREERERRADQWVSAVGLAGFERQYPSQLSGGMQQRVGLARALCVDPHILLMDEAFSALDPLIRGQMQDLLMMLQARLRKTIVFITHDLDEALRLGDRIAILKDGVVVQVGRPADILLQPADDYVRSFVREVNRGRVLTVATAMQPPPLRLSDETLDQAWAAMHRCGAEVGYVEQPGGYRGVVTRASLAEAIARDGARAAVAAIAAEVKAVKVEDSLADALATTLIASVPVPVVGRDGALKGVLTRNAMAAILAPPRPEPDAATTVPGSLPTGTGSDEAAEGSRHLAPAG